MAIKRDITIDDEWFITEDKILRCAIYEDDAMTTPVNVTGWTFTWHLRRQFGNTIVIEKTSAAGSITITGVFNSNPALNTQRVLVDIDSADTLALQTSGQLACYHRLRRVDPGAQTVLVYGDVKFLQA